MLPSVDIGIVWIIRFTLCYQYVTVCYHLKLCLIKYEIFIHVIVVFYSWSFKFTAVLYKSDLRISCFTNNGEIIRIKQFSRSNDGLDDVSIVKWAAGMIFKWRVTWNFAYSSRYEKPYPASIVLTRYDEVGIDTILTLGSVGVGGELCRKQSINKYILWFTYF